MEFILASTSPYRANQLKTMGLSFKVRSPKFDENQLKGSQLPPKELAEILAKKKAQSLAQEYPDDLILGGDQVVALENRIFSKPGTPEKAIETLKELSGKTHQIYTSIALIYKTGLWTHTDTTSVSLRSLTEERIRSYVLFDNPVDCAGACKWESGGIALFKSLQTEDPSAITGIPIIK